MSFIGGIKNRLKKITLKGVLRGALVGASGQALGDLDSPTTATSDQPRYPSWTAYAIVGGVVLLALLLGRRR